MHAACEPIDLLGKQFKSSDHCTEWGSRWTPEHSDQRDRAAHAV